MRPSKATRHLKYKFDESEIKAKAYELARETRELRSLNESKKEIMADFTSKIKSKEGGIDRNSEHIANGYEYRMVECEIQYNFPTTGIKLFTRKDTGEIWEEPMTRSEMQEELFEEESEKEEE